MPEISIVRLWFYVDQLSAMFLLKLNLETITDSMRAKGPRIIERLTLQMTRSMIEVQSHIINETLEQFFADGGKGIAASIRAHPVKPAKFDGSKITAEVEAGGPQTTKETLGGPNAGKAVDYAAVQEEGVAHSWEINPVLYGIAYSTLPEVSRRARKGAGALGGDASMSLEDRRALGGGLPLALAFEVGGETVIVRRVIHPPLRPRPFMLAGLTDMEPKIINDLKAAITSAIAE